MFVFGLKIEEFEYAFQLDGPDDEKKGLLFKKENGTIDTSSKGEQRLIFDSAIETLKNYDENKEYIVNDEIKEIVEEIKNILRMKEPYSKIPTIPLLIEKYNNKILLLLEEESIPVLGFIQTCKKEVIETLENYDFKNKFFNQINEEFNSLVTRTEKANSFAVLSSMSDLSEKLKLKWIKEIVTEDERQKRIKAKEIETANRVAETRTIDGNNTGYVVEPVKPEPEVVIKTKTLSMRELVKGQKVIKNTTDINEVVEALRKKLEEELEQDTIISLI